MRNNRFLATAIACAVVIIGLVLGFFVGRVREEERKEKVFSFHGMEITLTEDFEELHLEDQEDKVGFRCGDMIIVAIEEKFTMYPDLEAYTVDAYSRMTMEMSDIDPALLKTDHGLTYYEGETDNRYMILIFYADADAFWEFGFTSPKGTAPQYRGQFLKWAQTVTLDN